MSLTVRIEKVVDMVEIKGEWKINGENRIYTWKDYDVIFTQLQANAGEYSDVYRLDVSNNTILVRRFYFRQFIRFAGKETKVTYGLIDNEPEGGFFEVGRYEVFPDLEVLAVKCIALTMEYEDKVLGDLNWMEFFEFRKKIVMEVTNLFQNASYFYFIKASKSEILFRFEPMTYPHAHWLGAVYETGRQKLTFLNNLEGLKSFMRYRKLEISEETIVEVIGYVKLTAIMQERRILSSSDDVADSKFVDERNLEEISKIVTKFSNTIRPPAFAKKNKEAMIKFYAITEGYPCDVEEWQIIKMGNDYEIRQRKILENVYYPDFISHDFEDMDNRTNYIA